MNNVTMQSTTLQAYAATGAAGANLDAPVPFLTPEALLTYCSTRLQGIDSQVATAFQQQQDANNAVTSINNVNTWMSENVANGWDMSGDPKSGGAYGQVTIGAIQAEINKLPPNSQGAQMLTKLRDDIANRMDSSGPPSKLQQALDSGTYWSSVPQGTPTQNDQQMIASLGGTPSSSSKIDPTMDAKAWTDALGDDVKTLNSGTDLMMISLQQLVSERQTAVQLATGMLQSLDDSAKSVVSNIHG